VSGFDIPARPLASSLEAIPGAVDAAPATASQGPGIAKLWRFRPGARMGAPVPAIVTIELTFSIR
jgi:hypothetical protein